jgi:excisionase family DNA binding protein
LKTQLEQEDIKAIALEVTKMIKPLLNRNDKDVEDTIFDVKGLAEYLKVTPKWIYEQTHLKSIPYYKLSNKTLRFKKKDIEKWINSFKNPAISEPTGKLRLLK